MFDLNHHPHRRQNPLTGEWVLLSPHRTDRPWKGELEIAESEKLPVFDSGCFLCPGNKRASGKLNDKYQGPYVFDNDFPALLSDTPISDTETHPFFRIKSQRGICKVICYSEKHNMSLSKMNTEDLRAVIEVWADQSYNLSKKYVWVQIFENKGSIMGCSNPHPHCQIWASHQVPNEPKKENTHQAEYFQAAHNNLLLEYINIEKREKKRIVAENNHWIAMVPFWATWPYETLLCPKAHTLRFHDLDNDQKTALGKLLQSVLGGYDGLFNTPFPYSMGWHGAPNDDQDYTHWHLHAHFYPPLLKSANIKKHMVGYEMLAEAQRDLTPETAASTLYKKITKRKNIGARARID